MTSILFSFSEPFPWSRCRNMRTANTSSTEKTEQKGHKSLVLIFITCPLTQTCVNLLLLWISGTFRYFMLNMPTDISTLRGCDERESREEGNVVLGVLIVCSLSMFYVTTTHCFSSTYGWVPGMCFLSLFLMTWVTSLTLHMLGRDGPTILASKNLKEGYCLQCFWTINLNFRKFLMTLHCEAKITLLRFYGLCKKLEQ